MSTLTDVTDASWEADVLGSDQPVLVDFWAPWCGPCKSMLPYVEKLAEEYDGKVKVVKLNTQDNAEIPAKYGITSIPTFLVIKHGEVQEQVIGSQRYDALKGVVDPHIG
ncbi:MAG: thioredoxin [Planctomycetota bacterium]